MDGANPFADNLRFDPALWETFAANLYYAAGDLRETGTCRLLAERLTGIDASHATGGNALPYLSTQPSHYSTVVRGVADAGSRAVRGSGHARGDWTGGQADPRHGWFCGLVRRPRPVEQRAPSGRLGCRSSVDETDPLARTRSSRVPGNGSAGLARAVVRGAANEFSLRLVGDRTIETRLGDLAARTGLSRWPEEEALSVELSLVCPDPVYDNVLARARTLAEARRNGGSS